MNQNLSQQSNTLITLSCIIEHWRLTIAVLIQCYEELKILRLDICYSRSTLSVKLSTLFWWWLNTIFHDQVAANKTERLLFHKTHYSCQPKEWNIKFLAIMECLATMKMKNKKPTVQHYEFCRSIDVHCWNENTSNAINKIYPGKKSFVSLRNWHLVTIEKRKLPLQPSLL